MRANAAGAGSVGGVGELALFGLDPGLARRGPVLVDERGDVAHGDRRGLPRTWPGRRGGVSIGVGPHPASSSARPRSASLTLGPCWVTVEPAGRRAPRGHRLQPPVERPRHARRVRLRQLGALAREQRVDGLAPEHEPALEVAGAQPHLHVQLGVRGGRRRRGRSGRRAGSSPRRRRSPGRGPRRRAGRRR